MCPENVLSSTLTFAVASSTFIFPIFFFWGGAAVVFRPLCNCSDIWHVVYVAIVPESREPFLLTRTTLAETTKKPKTQQEVTSQQGVTETPLTQTSGGLLIFFFFLNSQIKDARQK